MKDAPSFPVIGISLRQGHPLHIPVGAGLTVPYRAGQAGPDAVMPQAVDDLEEALAGGRRHGVVSVWWGGGMGIAKGMSASGEGGQEPNDPHRLECAKDGNLRL